MNRKHQFASAALAGIICWAVPHVAQFDAGRISSWQGQDAVVTPILAGPEAVRRLPHSEPKPESGFGAPILAESGSGLLRPVPLCLNKAHFTATRLATRTRTLWAARPPPHAPAC